MSTRHTRFAVESLAVQLFTTAEGGGRDWTRPDAIGARHYWRRKAVLMLDEETISVIGNDGTWRNHWTGDGHK